MCRQFYLEYPGCGCELRLGPLAQCCFGPADHRCHAVLNITRPSPEQNCPFHARFFRRQRPFTYTSQGFQLWAGGRHRNVYWPIGKNPNYHPRSWDYFGEPREERDTIKASPAANGMINSAAERRFGLWKQANFDEWTRDRHGAVWAGGGYEADDEAARTKRPLRRATTKGGKGGYWYDWRDSPESSPAAGGKEEGDDDDDDGDGRRDDGWLDIPGEGVPNVVPLRAPALMWGCWDNLTVADESDEKASEITDGDSEGYSEYSWEYSEMEIDMYST